MLLHDGSHIAMGYDRSQSVQATERILDRWKERERLRVRDRPRDGRADRLRRTPDADLHLARLPPRRHRVEHLHAPARARVGPRGARRDRVLPGARTRALRPRGRGDRQAGCRRAAARLRDRPLRGLRGEAACRTARARSSTRWVEANAAALREHGPADLVFVNHVLLGGAVGAASGSGYVVKAHGSELEYSMRGNAGAVGVGRGGARERVGDDRRLGAHPQRRPRGLRGGRRRPRDPAGRRRRALAPRAARARRSRSCSPSRGSTRRTRATPRSGCPTRATPSGSRPSWPATARPSSTSAS